MSRIHQSPVDSHHKGPDGGLVLHNWQAIALINDGNISNTPLRYHSVSPHLPDFKRSWWRHQTETFSALLALCAGNSTVNGEFPSQDQWVTQSCGVFFYLRLNKRLNIQSWGWWFETPTRPLWSHCNVLLGQSRPSRKSSPEPMMTAVYDVTLCD